MSWSVGCVGPLKVVKKSVKQQFKNVKPSVQGEEAVLLELARKLVVRQLKTHPAHIEVAVTAIGSATGVEYDQTTGQYAYTTQNIHVQVNPKYPEAM